MTDENLPAPWDRFAEELHAAVARARTERMRGDELELFRARFAVLEENVLRPLRQLAELGVDVPRFLLQTVEAQVKLLDWLKGEGYGYPMAIVGKEHLALKARPTVIRSPTFQEVLLALTKRPGGFDRIAEAFACPKRRGRGRQAPEPTEQTEMARDVIVLWAAEQVLAGSASAEINAIFPVKLVKKYKDAMARRTLRPSINLKTNAALLWAELTGQLPQAVARRPKTVAEERDLEAEIVRQANRLRWNFSRVRTRRERSAGALKKSR